MKKDKTESFKYNWMFSLILNNEAEFTENNFLNSYDVSVSYEKANEWFLAYGTKDMSDYTYCLDLGPVCFNPASALPQQRTLR